MILALIGAIVCHQEIGLGSIAGLSERIRNLWWRQLPRLAQRWSATLSAALADGLYLSAWPAVSAFGPPVALLVGVAVGWLHFAPGETYTYSLPLLGLLVLLGSSSAGLGLWFVFGYVLGDLLLFKHAGGGGASILDVLTREVVPLLIAYVLLAILVVIDPLVSHGLRRLTVPRRLGRGLPRQVLEVGLQAGFQAMLVFAWVQSTPTLIRPVYTWRGSAPPIEAIQPLQQFGLVLIIVAALGGIGRMLLEYRAGHDPRVVTFAANVRTELNRAAPSSGLHVPQRLGPVLQAAFLTLIVSGALTDWLDAIVFFVVVGAVLLARRELVLRYARWTGLVSRVPLIIRVLVAGGLSYLIATQVLTAMWAGSTGFRPVILGTAASLVLFGLLVPGRVTRPPPKPLNFPTLAVNKLS